MAWIESHEELKDHPKTKRLARRLGISIPAAVGHLHIFWWWAMNYAENGNLSKFDNEDIADAAGWEGAADEFVSAMVECGPGDSAGFLEITDDGALFVHDWDQYIGRLIEKKEQNRERQKRFKSKSLGNALPNAEVTRDSRVSNDATNHTNHTNQPKDTPPTPPDGGAPDGRLDKRRRATGNTEPKPRTYEEAKALLERRKQAGSQGDGRPVAAPTDTVSGAFVGARAARPRSGHDPGLAGSGENENENPVIDAEFREIGGDTS